MNESTRVAVAELLVEASRAHDAAAPANDPEWPMWFAGYLAPKLPQVLGCTPVTQSLLTKLMLDAESEHQAKAPESPWQHTFAQLLVDRLATPAQATLALYHFASCPFCRRVRRAIAELGIEDEIELRDIFENLEFRNELVAARGRPTVPVLRCSFADGSAHFMPESADIIRFLKDRFGSR